VNAAGAAALLFWYGIEFARRQTDGRAQMKQSPPVNVSETVQDMKITDKVEHVLTEAWVVLPRAQALLGPIQSATLDDFQQAMETMLLGYTSSTIRNLIKRHRLLPVPKRRRKAPHYS
jgi:hypothetical protein